MCNVSNDNKKSPPPASGASAPLPHLGLPPRGGLLAAGAPKAPPPHPPPQVRRWQQEDEPDQCGLVARTLAWTGWAKCQFSALLYALTIEHVIINIFN